MPIKYMRRQPKCQDWARAVKARANNARISYKDCHETAACLKGMTTYRAKMWLKHVTQQREIVPFRRHTGGISRHAQCKGTGCSQGRWPKKVAYFLIDMVRNLERNANFKGLKKQSLYISHVAVQRAREGKRRTYRAHGRINPFNSHPCHIEMFAEEKAKKVPKPEEPSLFQKNIKLLKVDKKVIKTKKRARKLFKVDD